MILDEIMKLANKFIPDKSNQEAFKTLLIYDVAVLRGDIQESKEEKMIRDNYKKAWLDFPERITEENVFLIDVPKTPEFIEYFSRKGR